MQLEFGALHIANFKAFVQEQTLDFSAYEPGVHFIRGVNTRVRRPESNGAAKSTIFDAASWCLFGRTVEGLRNPEVAPWSKPSAPTRVEWWLRIDDKSYVIRRETNPNMLLVDGEKVDLAYVEQLIGMNCQTFNHAVLLGQGQNLFFDLPPSEKMNIFSEVLNLDRWEIYSDKAKKLTSELENKQLELKTEEEVYDASIEELAGLIKTAEERSKEWVAERKERLERIRATMATLNEDLTKTRALHDHARLASDTASLEADSTAKELAGANETLREAERLSAASLGELRTLRRGLEELGEADSCPMCGQSLAGTDLGAHKKELRKKIKAATAVADRAAENRNHAERARDRMQKSYLEFSRKARDAQSHANLYGPQATELETKLRGLHEQLIASEKDHDAYREQAVELKRKVRDLEEHRAVVLEDLSKLAKRLARTQFWIKGFKEVRLFKIEEVLQELQMVSNSLLADVGLEDWELSYDVERETKSGTIRRGIVVSITSPDSGRPVRWEGWSGGERQRLRLIGALALGEVLLGHAGVTPSMVVLDEPTRDLSDEGVEDLCAFLAERAETLGLNVFLIDHMSNPSSHFKSTITVRKGKNGTSEIIT